MKKDKRYYVDLVEELGKKIIKEKNKIGSYADNGLKKPYGCINLGYTTNDEKIEIGLYIRRKD